MSISDSVLGCVLDISELKRHNTPHVAWFQKEASNAWDSWRQKYSQ